MVQACAGHHVLCRPDVSPYLVWHPLDHISYTVRRHDPYGRIGPGAELHIREALGRNPDNLLDIHATVEAIDDAGSVIVKRLMGTIGDTTWLGRLILNQIAHRRALPPARIQPWIRHHVEEIGNLEHLLPGLFRECADEEVPLDYAGGGG